MRHRLREWHLYRPRRTQCDSKCTSESTSLLPEGCAGRKRRRERALANHCGLPSAPRWTISGKWRRRGGRDLDQQGNRAQLRIEPTGGGAAIVDLSRLHPTWVLPLQAGSAAVLSASAMRMPVWGLFFIVMAAGMASAAQNSASQHEPVEITSTGET